MKLLNKTPSVLEKEQRKNLENFLRQQEDLRQLVWEEVLENKIKNLDTLDLHSVLYMQEFKEDDFEDQLQNILINLLVLSKENKVIQDILSVHEIIHKDEIKTFNDTVKKSLNLLVTESDAQQINVEYRDNKLVMRPSNVMSFEPSSVHVQYYPNFLEYIVTNSPDTKSISPGTFLGHWHSEIYMNERINVGAKIILEYPSPISFNHLDLRGASTYPYHINKIEYYDLVEDEWRDITLENIKPSVISVLSFPPSAPSHGDRHLCIDTIEPYGPYPGFQANLIYEWDQSLNSGAGGWFGIEPEEGDIVRIENQNRYMRYTGVQWVHYYREARRDFFFSFDQVYNTNKLKIEISQPHYDYIWEKRVDDVVTIRDFILKGKDIDIIKNNRTTRLLNKDELVFIDTRILKNKFKYELGLYNIHVYRKTYVDRDSIFRTRRFTADDIINIVQIEAEDMLPKESKIKYRVLQSNDTYLRYDIGQEDTRDLPLNKNIPVTDVFVEFERFTDLETNMIPLKHYPLVDQTRDIFVTVDGEDNNGVLVDEFGFDENLECQLSGKNIYTNRPLRDSIVTVRYHYKTTDIRLEINMNTGKPGYSFYTPQITDLRVKINGEDVI